MTTPEINPHFPKDKTCPVCGTGADTPSVLIPSLDERNRPKPEPVCLHINCAVIQAWDERRRVGFAVPLMEVVFLHHKGLVSLVAAGRMAPGPYVPAYLGYLLEYLREDELAALVRAEAEKFPGKNFCIAAHDHA